jgi:hypothetical protein
MASSPAFRSGRIAHEKPSASLARCAPRYLLRHIFHIGEPPRERHGRHMHSGHLRGKHDFSRETWQRDLARLSNHERCAESSGDLLPPSPPGEKATARQEQAGKASTGDGAGDR